MFIVYKLGNFQNGKSIQTTDKGTAEAYQAKGYKLIATVAYTMAQWIKALTK